MNTAFELVEPTIAVGNQLRRQLPCPEGGYSQGAAPVGRKS